MADQRQDRRSLNQGLPRTRQRRALSCLPCRLHKLRCDRSVPCQSCRRFERQDRCRQNPAPALALARPAISSNSRGSALGLPLTPISVSGAYAGRSDPISQSSNGTLAPNDDWSTPDSDSTSSICQTRRTRFRPELGRIADLDSERNENSGIVSVEALALQNSSSPKSHSFLDEPQIFWKHHLASTLPAPTQCDLLVFYFFENVNWIYQAIHSPSFRAEYGQFWSKDVADIDLIWMALLFMMLSVSSLYIPAEMAEAAGLEASELALLSRRWYSASRHALQAGSYDSKPTLMQIQVFLISQMYWYSVKNIEALNSHLGQAVRNAQALGLDKESPSSITSCLEREMRHRIWWDLVSSDTFQSLCLGRPPLLQSYLSSVPFPSNCSDTDITVTNITIRPISEPTEMSMHCFRARIFAIFNKLQTDNGANLSSYSFVSSIDSEISAIEDEFPWYFELSQQVPRLPANLSSVFWAHHILHSCICIQRIRMYRPFLHPRIGESWQRCVSAAMSALSVYKNVRSEDNSRFRRSHKMHVQAYQTLSASVVIATFLLVELPPNAEPLRADVEMVITDLQHFITRSDSGTRSIPMVSDGLKVLCRIFAMYDARCNNTPQNNDGDGDAPTALVPGIFSVFGGESSARKYLERCAIDYIVNDDSAIGSSVGRVPFAVTEGSSWETLLAASAWGEWGDSFWADLDSAIGGGGVA